ncbi:hypothetical protein WR25_25382 [Diploscapter pachys]|uniref:EamA domain-containing protein n=1 Tax=Diploscapter pachys TaxID=2018661 RepID=A0A2A2JRW4_9BILA|nr:hypothetical protein WR25_25382 [Diploscapter pachys]
MNRKFAKSGDVTSKNEEGKANAGFFGSKTFAIFAMAAGFCGASAAIVGKLTFSGWNHSGPIAYLWLSLFIGLNVLMWMLYVKSLALSRSTTVAMLCSMGTNLTITGLLSWAFLNEMHSWLWWVGNLVTQLGIAIILLDSSNVVEHEKKD